MYPRNAASPERVSIGPVVQISDGAVQTSGVAVKVVPFGGAEASGAGTIAYSADGVVLYTPTQAETNFTSFVLIASKSGCIPASATIVTTAQSTAGTVQVGSIAANAINAASIAASALNSKGNWNVGKTGYSLTATTGLGNQTANITGNLSGSVGSVTAGVTISGTTTTLDALQTALNSAHGAGSWATATGFSTHSAADVWAVGTRTITGGSLTTAPPTVAAIAGAVWDEARAGHTTSGTFGFYLDAQVSDISGGGGGSGDATLAKQEEILDAIDTYFSQVLATVDGTADTIVGFPATLTIGNSYTTDGGNAIHVFIRDENDAPITSVGTHDFTDPDFSCDLIITNSGNAGRVRATVTYVDPGVAESYLKVEIPLSESSRAAAGAATMQCTLKWDGVAKTIATQTVTWVARI